MMFSQNSDFENIQGDSNMNEFNNIKTVMLLAPHTDDGEFGCGGTMAKLLEAGVRVVYIAFSTCQASIPYGLPGDILAKEMNLSMDFFGIPEEDRVILDYPVRNFTAHRQKILDDMIKLNRKYKPDMVLMPSDHDIHQDHHTIAEEAMRAFKRVTLLGYEVPWNNYTFNNQAYITLEERHIKKKIGAIACYETQKERNYADESFTRGLARTHGVQIGAEYAEVFEVVRWIL